MLLTPSGYPPTAVGYPPTGIGYPPTAIGYPPTASGYPPTAIGYPPTAIVGRIGHSEFFFFYGNPWALFLSISVNVVCSKGGEGRAGDLAILSLMLRRVVLTVACHEVPVAGGDGRKRSSLCNFDFSNFKHSAVALLFWIPPRLDL